MDIYPQDLGPLGQSVLTSLARDSQYLDDSAWPHWAGRGAVYGGLGAMLSLGTGVLTGAAALGWLCFLMTSAIAVVAAMMHRGGSTDLLRDQGPLTVYEVRNLQADSRDPLRQPYLDLVIAAMNTPPPEDEAQLSVREALCALGGSLTGLPQPMEKVTWDDPTVFQAQAQQLMADAAAEGDPVIVASLHRRAEALRRQAETSARTNTLLRRNEALRAEVAGQIAALQTSLTALRVGGAQAVYELAGVAASIQQVAVEAGALTQARSEIGEIVNSQALIQH